MIKQRAAMLKTKCIIRSDLVTTPADEGWIYAVCEFHGKAARQARGDNSPFFGLRSVALWLSDETGRTASLSSS